MLMKKVDALAKSIEVQIKKPKKEKAVASSKVEGQKSYRNVARSV